jgi:hypothetical protein
MPAAARENVPANTVYLGRYTYGATLRDVLREPSRGEEMLAAQRDVYCKQEIGRARSGGRRGYIFVLLSDEPRPEDRRRDGSGRQLLASLLGHDIARGLTKVVCGPLDHRIRARKSNVIRHAVEVMAEAR